MACWKHSETINLVADSKVSPKSDADTGRPLCCSHLHLQCLVDQVDFSENDMAKAVVFKVHEPGVLPLP